VLLLLLAVALSHLLLLSPLLWRCQAAVLLDLTACQVLVLLLLLLLLGASDPGRYQVVKKSGGCCLLHHCQHSG
jgi:hypothetical protein